MTKTDFERYFANMRKIGVPLSDEQIEKDVDRCAVCEKSMGTEPSYYRRFALNGDSGLHSKWSWRPLRVIGYCMANENANVGSIQNTLIGFLYEDGTVRQDWYQVLKDCYEGDAIVNWPRYVLFWKDYVPLAMRGGLAAAIGPHDNRVIV